VVRAYILLFAVTAAVLFICFRLGATQQSTPEIAGAFEVLDSDAGAACWGRSFDVKQSGRFVSVDGEGEATARLELNAQQLAGDATCADGSAANLNLRVVDSGNQQPALTGSFEGERFDARFVGELPEALEGEQPEQERSGEEIFGRLMLAIAAVILAARLVGAAVGRIGQPKVMGEVIAGILLGPTLLGAVAPDVKDFLFPGDIVPLLSAGADIGLAFYMFLVGLELDPGLLRGRVAQAAVISNASVAAPIALGVALAVPLYPLLAPEADFLPFALFMGVAMSITAFPVLARILIERRLIKRPVGAMSLAAAAIDDVTAWGLLALSSAIALSGSGTGAAKVIGLAVLFCVAMAFVGRPLLSRVSDAYDESGHVPAGWIAAIFVGVLLSAYVSQEIGIAAIFGAFVMGLIMPRRADLTHDVTRRLEDFVVTVLLPLFFVVTGLKTEIGLVDRPELWLLTLAVLVVAVACKWLGAMGAARYTGFSWREASAIGALMNTRGLTELIVLTIGLELGVITPALFTMLVIMALVTTFMTGPALRLIDPSGELSSPVEEEIRKAEKVTAPAAPEPDRSILVAPEDEHSLDRLLALAEPLARSDPPREIIIAQALVPARSATGLLAEERELSRVNRELQLRRGMLVEHGVAVRAVAFTSSHPGQDIARLASEHEVDLVIVDGHKPLLGSALPRGPVATVLSDAPSDVAVVVERVDALMSLGEEHPVLVPFGGAEHDWAALELGAWIASSAGAPLRLLGTEAPAGDGERDASMLLANASLVVQQLGGVAAEPVLARPGERGVLEAARDAGLLVIGLSDRWRSEGLGPVRAEIAQRAPVPTVFVRRGTRPGALAARDDVTHFNWSRAWTGA
jgi:Kef-type K+ transport system membrane component KefB